MRRFFLLVPALLALACLDPNAGTSSAGGSSTQSAGTTVGSQCTAIEKAFCTRAIDTCMVQNQGTSAECVQTGVPACCGGVDCATTAISTDAEIQKCLGDIASTACAAFNDASGGAFPTSCRGVVRAAAH